MGAQGAQLSHMKRVPYPVLFTPISCLPFLYQLQDQCNRIKSNSRCFFSLLSGHSKVCTVSSIYDSSCVR